MAGGNGILSVLGSPAVSMSNGMSTPQASPAGAVVSNSEGASAPVGHVQIATVALLVLSLAVLIGLNKAGFRFSVTVG
jgi:hypothetical protein